MSAPAILASFTIVALVLLRAHWLMNLAVTLGGEQERPPITEPSVWSDGKAIRLRMAVGVSLLVLIAALWIILVASYPADQEKWAYGAIGAILGYWLHPPEGS